LDLSGLTPESISISELQGYMGLLGAEFPGPRGVVWRQDKPPLGPASLKAMAACLKAFYLYLGALGANRELAEALRETRLPRTVDRRRSFLGHTLRSLPTNPLAPTHPHRRHPKLPPEGARKTLIEAMASSRDKLIVTWLADAGMRVGELCGLRLEDLHLRDDAPCGECRSAHLHLVHREGNSNGARSKTKLPWSVEAGTVRGGLVRRASPAMIHAYFAYMSSEYPRGLTHSYLLVQQHGSAAGEPLSPDAVRGLLRRRGLQLDLGRVRPHSFRHQFATDVLDASGGNSVIAREAGGWASAKTVETVYGHPDLHSPDFKNALETVWSRNE